MMLEATIYRALPRVLLTAIGAIPPTNNPCSQVVSVTREDAAEPYITNFWPSNTSNAAVTSATHTAGGPVTALLLHAIRGPSRTISANTQRGGFNYMTAATRRWAKTDATRQTRARISQRSGHIATPRWYWLPAIPPPASTASAAAICSRGFAGGCPCSSSTRHPAADY